MPSSSRDFQRAARQRLATAEFLLKNRYTLDAMYLAGYTVECTLKALILEKTLDEERADRLLKISSGKQMHNAENLAQILEDLGHPIPRALLRKILRFRWSTALRYEYGRTDMKWTRGFLKTVKEVCDWVEGQLP